MLARKFILFGLVALTGLIITAACAPVQLLNSVTPSSGFEKSSDISFADHERLKLDVYRPKDGAETGPVLVFVHGGSWLEGSKDIYKFMAESLTRAGLTAVIPNYRLHPGIKFPDPVIDTTKAVAWTAREYSGRPIFLMGHSAGGYNILMTALDPQFLEDENIDRCTSISGVISLAGPVGIVPLKEEPYITIFPDRFTAKDAPLNQAHNPAPPILLINGDKDRSVYPQNAERLAAEITERGGNATVKIYKDMNHIDAVKFFSKYFDGDSTLKADVVEFIRKNSAIKPDYCQ